MGDFNTGPAKGSNDGELAANYDALLSMTGLSSPYADQDDPACTYCAGNTLVGSSGSVVIDHVLLGIPNAASAAPARIYDQTTTIATSEGTLETNLSDHFGVSVEVTLDP